MLADDDPTSVIAAEENARLHSKSTTKLVDNKSNTIALGALTGKKGERKKIPATTTANTTFAFAPSIADVVSVIEPPTAKVSIATLADDDPTFIGGVTKHSLSENSKA